MLRFILCGAQLISFCAAAGIIGEDSRRAPVDEETDLVRALGHVVCMRAINGVRRRSAGTATIVGSRNTILTAAHVFTDRAGRRGPEVRFVPEDDCTFRQYDTFGNVSVEVGFQQTEMGEYRENPGMPNQDWAVLRTAQLLPESTVALPFANYAGDLDGLSGMAIRILAYHADIRAARRVPLSSEGELLTVEYGGYMRLAHTADMGRMSSGAAIVHRTHDGDFVVVGINRSSAKLGEFNLAVPLSIELLATLRSYAHGYVPTLRQRLALLTP